MLKTATPCFLGNTDCGGGVGGKPAPATSIQTLRTTDCQPWHSPAIVCTALFNKFLIAPLLLRTPVHGKRRKKISRECSCPLQPHSSSPGSCSASSSEKKKKDREAEMKALCLGLFRYLVLSPLPLSRLFSFDRHSAEDRHLPDDREMLPE